MMKNNSLFNIFCLIFCGIFVFFIILNSPGNSENYEKSRTLTSKKLQPKNPILDTISTCLRNKFSALKNSTSVGWMSIPQVVKECTTEIANMVPLTETTPLYPEQKFYMVPRAMYINEPCSIITFGIGGEISAEQQMKISMPQCTFIGFDPNEKYEGIFVNGLGGKFVRAAVGGKNGKSTILKFNEVTYLSEPETQVRSAAELIETYHGKDKPIDILNIDVEGSEYSILERLLRDKVFKNACQINVEIHPVWYNNNAGYSYEEAMKIFEQIAEDGTFLWTKSRTHTNQFYCAYFLNVKNPICSEKYLIGRLL